MNAEQKRLAREIFADALEKDDVRERAAWVAHACGADAELRELVEALLQAHEQGGESPGQALLAAFDQPLDEVPGTRIGRYKLLEQIGEGGFGVVFMAEQTEPVHRKVALKIIKAGMDTKEVIARFEAERQALALMDHPNIAKVFDGGVTGDRESQIPNLESPIHAGRPYFVMELVKGIPLTDYCDLYHLSTHDRLQLFLQVCQAVQHAHQKGIIHRDLKPSNILVTEIDGKAVPKIIDFGVAKALGQRLTQHTLFTAFAQMVGTPAYMSPEQAALSGMDIDTRSDIYALGVLLYELLTGVTPFDRDTLHRAALEEIRRLIREVEPAKPSTRLRALGDKLTAVAQQRQTEPGTLTRLVHGDLDWIVMKCLEKDRARRYETASALAEDLRHHLQHQPVRAGPPSTLYRAGKFVRRHRMGVALAASVTVALVAGLIASLIGFREARLERDHAIEAEQAAQAERDRAVAAEVEAEKQQARAEEMARGEAEQHQRAEQTVMRLERQRAEDAFNEGNPSLGLAYLAWVLRKDPTNDAVAERIISALTYRNFPLPKFDPLQHGDGVNSALFSARGDRIVTASADKSARVWDAVTGQPVTEPLAHQDPVSYAEFSPDGQWVLTVSSNICRLWDARSGVDLGVRIVHQDLICSARFSPDGKNIVTASADRTARISDAETGQMLAGPLQHKSRVSCAEFSPDGQAVVTVSWDKTARLWDAKTGQPLTESLVHEGLLRFGCFSPDGKWVLAGGGAIAQLWDTSTRTPTGKVVKQAYGGWGVVLGGQFSPAGKQVVTASGDLTAKVWDPLTGRSLLPLMHHEGWVTCAEFAPNGWSIVTASNDGMARLWKRPTGRLAALPIRHQLPVVSARFSPDSQYVLTASADGTAGVWDARCGAAATVNLHGHSAGHCEFSPDGQRVVTASVYDARTGAPVCGQLMYKGGLHSARFSPHGRYVVTASWDTTAGIWDAQTGERVTAPLKHGGSVRSARFSPDGERVVTVPISSDKAAVIWSIKGGGQLLQRLKHGDGVSMATFHPDNRRVLTASHDGTAMVWDGDTGQPLIKPLRHAGSITSAEFSRDGQRIVTASSDGTARVWDASIGEPLTKPLRHNGQVLAAEFSPNGLLVATAAKDSTARIWDAHTGAPLTEPLGHDEWVLTVQFGPDSRRVVTCTRAGSARVWDAYTGLPRSEVLKHSGGPASASLSPDGQRVLTASMDTLPGRIWDVPNAPLPIPLWLPLLAEAVGHQRFSTNGALESVPVTKIIALNRSILAGPANDSYTQWARWFFADRTTRTISPFSSVPVTNSLRWLLEQTQYPETTTLLNLDLDSVTDWSLNNLAWRLATDADPKERDAKSAIVLAETAVAFTRHANAGCLDTLAAAYAEAGQFTNAVKTQKEALALLKDEDWRDEGVARLKLYLTGLPYRDDEPLAQKAGALLEEGRFPEAEFVARRCLALREKQIPDSWLAANARSLLGGSLLGQKKYAEAEPLLLSGYEGMKQREAKIPANGKANLSRTLQLLMQLYETTDRPAQAAEWKQKLAEFERAETEKATAPAP